MRWPTFAVVTYVLLVLQVGLGTLLDVPHAGPPIFLLPLATFVGMRASTRAVVIVFLCLGLLTDLTHPVALAEGPASVALVGPATLGYLLGAYAILQLRAMVYRDSLLTLVVMTFLLGIPIHLATTALLALRGLPWPLGEPLAHWSAADEIVRRFLQLLYTTLWAIPLGFLLRRSDRWWAFEPKAAH